MKLAINLVLGAVFVLASLCLSAQSSKYEVQLKHQTFTPEKSPSSLLDQPETYSKTLFQDTYQLIVQFDDIPDNATQEQLSNTGIQLQTYVGGQAYIAAVSKTLRSSDVEAFNIRTITEIPIESKISDRLQVDFMPAWALNAPGKIDLVLLLNTDKIAAVQTMLQNQGYEVLGNLLNNPRHLEVRAGLNTIENLAALPFVSFIEPIKEADAKLNHYAIPAMRVAPLTANFLGNYQCTGEGVTIGVGEGGLIQGHIDFQDRVTNNTTLSLWGAHTYHVAGIASGTGNRDPWNKGIAYRAMMILELTSNILTQAETHYAEGMLVTNNSYGPSTFNCADVGAYTASSQNVDQQMRDMEGLMHIIAGGNSGAESCAGYPAGYRTLLRNYAANKNAVTVGATSHRSKEMVFSSKGPVMDGRLKPDIVAPGYGIRSAGLDNDYTTISGSSMATPGITGIWALLVEDYRKRFNTDPNAALLKAYLLNTSQDLGNPGPDYSFGWGMVDASRAAKSMQNSDFFTGSIEQGTTAQHSIIVPEGAEEVRIMLYWHDVAGTPATAKALVNDLNLLVTTPAENNVNPWVLDPTPANVANDAIRGVDNLNNVEQVTLRAGAGEVYSGTHTIQITGNEVPFGPQEYFIVYEVIMPGVDLVYPVGGEAFIAGSREFIRWNAVGEGAENVNVYYSINDGVTWTEIPTNPEHIPFGYVDFTFPEGLPPTTEGRIKVSINGGAVSDVNEYPFVLMKRPVIDTETSCGGNVYLSWNDIPGAVAYEVMHLGDRFMEPLAITEATTYIATGLAPGTEQWYSVRPIAADDSRGFRAIAEKAIMSTTICDDFADVRARSIVSPINTTGRQYTNNSLSPNQAITVELENMGNIPASNFDVIYDVNGTTITDVYPGILEPGEVELFTFSLNKDFSVPGTYTLRARTALVGDMDANNNEVVESVVMTQLPNAPVTESIDIYENFNSITPEVIQGGQIGIGSGAFDFVTSTQNGELIFGSDFTIEPAATINNVASGVETINQLILTKNLSNFSVYNAPASTGPQPALYLAFRYINHGQASNANNRIFVRGSDTHPWIEVYDLDANEARGVFAQVNAFDIADNLRAAGQDLSSSFQISFNQSGTSSADDPVDSDGFTFDDIQLQESFDLPIELISFEAYKANNQTDVILNWATASETNNDYFIIELATESNGQIGDFTELTRVNGAGTTTIQQYYEYVDTEPAKNTKRYYRLKQVDFDGASAYSDVRTIDFSDENPDVIQVFPVPFKEGFNVVVKTEAGSELYIRVSDVNGKLVKEQHATIATAGTHQETIQLGKNIPAGTYFLQVKVNDYIHSRKIVRHSDE